MPKTVAHFPLARLRRTRKSAALRDLVREHELSVNDLILPMFIQAGKDSASTIPSMPGVERLSVDRLVKRAVEIHELGIPAICLFPYTAQEQRTEDCAEAWSADNLSNTAIRAIKAEVPEDRKSVV